MARRGPFALAIVAALLWAPSIAFSASNELHSPVLSPTSGTSATTFVLRVSYDGRFPAGGIEATVASLTVELRRVSGTAEAGTWQGGISSLPAGRWTVTFTAIVDRGAKPVLEAGPLDVTAPKTPQPTASGRPSSPKAEQPSATAPSPSGPSHPATAPAAPAAPTPTPVPVTTAPAGNTVDEPSAEPAPTKTPAPDDGGGDASRAEPDVRDGTAGGAPVPGPASPGTAPGSRSPAWSAPDGAPVDPGHLPRDATNAALDEPSGGLPIGIVSGILLLAVAMVLVVVARAQRPEPAGAAPILHADTTAILERRALRRARVVLEDDPIVSSIGIDDAALAERSARRRLRPRAGRA